MKFLIFLFPVILLSQTVPMTPEVYENWKKIENVQISNDGDWVTYRLTSENEMETLHLYNTSNGEKFEFPFGYKAKIDHESKFIVFQIKPHPDTVRALKLKKVKKNKMPKDSLKIFNTANAKVKGIKNVKSYKMPDGKSGYLAWLLHPVNKKQDSTKVKDDNKTNGSTLLIEDFNKRKVTRIDYVKDYNWADKNHILGIHTTGMDTMRLDSILLYDASKGDKKMVMSGKGDYSQLSVSSTGDKLGCYVKADSTQQHILNLWDNNAKKLTTVNQFNRAFPEGWVINKNKSIEFSEDNKRVYYGISPEIPQKDSTLLDSDKANVEVWNYQDNLLHTQQNVNLKRDQKKTFIASYNFYTQKYIAYNDESNPEIRINDKNQKYAVSYNDKPYQKEISWKGYAYKDVWLHELESNQKIKIGTEINGSPRLSPNEHHITWYNSEDTTWINYSIDNKKTYQLTQSGFYDELNDRPMHPRPSGRTVWIGDDEAILLYDHFDIYMVSPTNQYKPKNLTNGRSQMRSYRHLNLDRDIRYIPSDTTILLRFFDEKTKESGYSSLNLSTGKLTEMKSGPYNYTSRIIKAKSADKLIYTRESFQEFPNLILSNSAMTNGKTITDANPQQKDYNWGSIELYEWTDYIGEKRQGLIVKPKNFNPAQKYPVIVNFYEKSSDRLHRHRAPYAHRSTINYSYYASKGYVIFNPDVYYFDGYPGESCYIAVMSGLDALETEGYVDTDNIGLQGHSWGGYQIAHLVTKTNRFKCAESGAPVVNMISAYGGIRWGSGMSRMFQYERTQSRVGATLWERPDLYIANSPIFNLNKIETPVLILHNDHDGAVPWYQGIEFFVGMRRLGKPAWMLNYIDEPHWPLTKPNRIDFNRRMEQFFDHYLKGSKMPQWMEEGIPATLKGIEYRMDEK